MKFKSFEPIKIMSSAASLIQTSYQFEASNRSHTEDIKLENNGMVKFDEGWTFITHKRSKKERGSLLKQITTIFLC